jgi:hypothetical protein
VPSVVSEKSVNLIHHGGGWVEFYCPVFDQSQTYVVDLHSDLKTTQSTTELNSSHKLKLKLLGLLAPKQNGNVVIELLAQALANDGTISLNSYIEGDDNIPADMPILWANIQFDGDINFAVNRVILDEPQFDAYAQGFIAVQNAFLDTIEQTLKTMRKWMLNAMRAVYATPFVATGSYYWQEISNWATSFIQ